MLNLKLITMKNILLSFSAFLLFVFATPISGQIKVNSSGKVGVGGWAATNSYEIQGNRAYFYDTRSTYDRTSYNYVYESAGIGASYSSEYTYCKSNYICGKCSIYF